MRMVVPPLLALMILTPGSAPAKRSLEALRRQPPFGIPAPVARQWMSSLDETYRLFGERRYAAMLEKLRDPLEWARVYRPNKLSLRTYTFSSAAHLARLDYPAALQDLIETSRQCGQILDSECTAVVESNLSSLYFKIQAMPEALDAAEQALAVREEVATGDNRLRMLLHKGRLLSRQGRIPESDELLRDVRLAAERAGSARVTAESLDTAGLERLARGDLEGAEDHMRQSLRLRWIARDPSLAVANRNLGLLRLRQKSLAGALAFSAKKGVATLAPDWTVAQMRARAHAAMGDHRKAVAEFESALQSMASFRLDLVPPALRSSAADRSRELYDELIESLAALHRQSPSRALLEAMLSTASASQALSLRRTMPAPSKAPGYWSALARLQASYRDAMEPGNASVGEIAAMRRRLIEIQAGTQFSTGVRAPRPDPSEVAGWQRKLGDAAILVYQVSGKRSYLWPVTAGSLGLCELPGRDTLAALVKDFRAELQEGVRRGPRARALSSTLLGGLPRSVLDRGDWRIVADGPLFDVPFAALPLPAAGINALVVERHSTAYLPGLWMFSEPESASWTGPLLAVADPVYNDADPRLPRGWFSKAIRPQLPRLSGTSAEVERCARAAGLGHRLLAGTAVTGTRVREELAAQPSIVHIATHVLPSPIEEREGLIALSPLPEGSLEFLGTEWIAAQDLRPELVVMSACRSGGGTIRSGDGLMGLTRAWLQAGARNVLATYWPTPDDPGTFLETFYRSWRPAAGARPEALRQAQLEAIRSGGWKAHPAFWAGFFLVGRPQLPAAHPQIEDHLTRQRHIDND